MAHVNCYCNRPAVLLTSSTNLNPGRRFYWRDTARRNGCRFFLWFDPPMQARATQVISGLLKKVRELENEKEGFKRREKVYWVVIICSLFLIALYMFSDRDVVNL